MEKNCNTCFYQKMQNSMSSPCQNCRNNDHYVKDSIYFWGQEETSGGKEIHVDPEDFDTVNKPKHYMLFPEEGIEVRDVIVKLVRKMDYSRKYHFDGIDAADYFQAMQYFMRFMEKNGKEDLEKGVWYMNKIIEAWEPENEAADS